jgi:hypothetical protein
MVPLKRKPGAIFDLSGVARNILDETQQARHDALYPLNKDLKPNHCSDSFSCDAPPNSLLSKFASAIIVTGFIMNLSIPISRAFSLVIFSLYPVPINTGISGRIRFTAFDSWSPVMPGIVMSVTSTS